MTTIDVYTDASGRHCWRLVAPGGRIVCASTASHPQRSELVREVTELVDDIVAGRVRVRVTGKQADPVAMQADKERLEAVLRAKQKD